MREIACFLFALSGLLELLGSKRVLPNVNRYGLFPLDTEFSSTIALRVLKELTTTFLQLSLFYACLFLYTLSALTSHCPISEGKNNYRARA